MKRTVLFLTIMLFIAHALQAQKPEVITKNKTGWHKIGDAKVDFKTDTHKFILTGKNKLKSLQLKVKDAPVIIENMMIEYQRKIKEEIALDSELTTGTESKIIELKHSQTGIKNVTFIYRTAPNSGTSKAEIELWGLK
jgi:hypothetical protein